MNRLVKDRYIPLTSKSLGDNHKLVMMLTATQGLIYAAAFGAAGKKGRLRQLIQPFSLCEGDLYFDPVKKLWSLKDGTALYEPDSFHESLRKYYAAVFWSELIRKTHGGAGSAEFFQLSAAFLEEMDRSSSDRVPSLLVSALWTFMDMEGIRPDLNSCARCGRKAPADRAVCYDPEGHVVCAGCRIGNLPVLSARARGFLLESREEKDLSTEDRETLFSYILLIIRSLTGFVFDQNGLNIIKSSS